MFRIFFSVVTKDYDVIQTSKSEWETLGFFIYELLKIFWGLGQTKSYLLNSNLPIGIMKADFFWVLDDEVR